MTVRVGDALPEWEMASVSPDRMKLYAALARDPSPIHWDRAEAARRGSARGVINQGPTSLGYVLNMVAAWAGPEALRRVEARFTDNVFEGDRVVAGGTVTRVVHDGLRTVAGCDVWLDRGGDRVVLGEVEVEIDGST